jgi:hypothetical protein
MQLDHARIAIRERSRFDVLDLALRTLRAYAWPLAVALAIGIVPAAVFNAWLLADMREPAFDESVPQSYLIWMLILVLTEIPLVTAPATLYLGKAAFLERPRPAAVAAGFFRALPQLLYFLVVRALFIPFIVTWFVPFAVWPYMNEVVLLERNRFRRRRRADMTTFRRVSAMHAGNGGDLFANWIGSMLIGGLLVAGLWLAMQSLAGLMTGSWKWEGLSFTLFYPLALWIVVGYFAVVRFLGYLDLRIRREGWEVELMMRAEAARLTRQPT